ncbi:MAG: hypothetical protein AAFP78_08585 [Pseudomonadota bacterium]
MRLLTAFGAIAIASTITAAAPAAHAAETLSASGEILPNAAFDAGGALEARIDVGDDEVLSVHAILRPASSNITWMRDRDGFWTDWSGRPNDLIESAAKRDGGDLVFKIFDAPPPGVTSMVVTVAYRTPEGLKYGWFNAVERAE